ncbi:MAG: peptidyl-prolyl cis-trans isomerase [Planctomycetes bacterium]|nr:peptidyl-prolyl cis-trans isomerase [Planctomycetota bacterium]
MDANIEISDSVDVNAAISDEDADEQRPEREGFVVKMETSMGDIVVELDKANAPVTVENFLGYVRDGFYDGTIFHRVIKGFMIQGGGFTEKMGRKAVRGPIVNEAANGLKNKRGTIAMARTPVPDSATSQFFINHGDNAQLDYVAGRSSGYAVFGKVVEGMDVVERIASVRTVVSNGERSFPVEQVVIRTVKVIE